MNKVILCEGKTDAILLGYYLGKVASWKKRENAPKGLEITPNLNKQSTNWYYKGEDNLLICAVGGNTMFKKFFEENILPPLHLVKDAFEKISVVIDRDDREIQEIEASVNSMLENVSVTVKVRNRSWGNCPYRNDYTKDKSLEILLLVVPQKSQGALEKVMLKAIAENEYDKKIVEETGKFAKRMRGIVPDYISRDSLELKAHLRLTWAIRNPENFATTFDEEISAVRWEESKVLQSCFSKLIEI